MVPYTMLYINYNNYSLCEYLQPKNKDKDKEKDKGQTEDDKKQEGEKLGCGRVIPIKQVIFIVSIETLCPLMFIYKYLYTKD